MFCDSLVVQLEHYNKVVTRALLEAVNGMSLKKVGKDSYQLMWTRKILWKIVHIEESLNILVKTT